MLSNLLFTLAGIVIGSFVSWIFYRRSGKELTVEAAKLRRLSEIMLYSMEDAGLVKLNRDEAGEIIGRDIVVTVAERVFAIDTFAPTVITKKTQE